MPIIEVCHVTKEFQLGQLHSLKQTALNGLRRLAGQPVEERKPFKALDDVSFSVEQGEVLGIIGHNGAGKSTLLKLLANISQPTHGSIKVRGRVAPLIEVGAGLIGDLTGRENIFLNGALLGMSRQEIKRKFDDIVAFAELEDFIDTPIKRYSSGMQVRLGFSIATSVESEILIVDEVLAVGDLAFQRKCFDRMESLLKKEHKTVLLVSHNIRQVMRLCSRTALMSHGKLELIGDTATVCNEHYAQTDSKIRQSLASAPNSAAARSEQASGEFILEKIEIISPDNTAIDSIEYFSDVRISIEFIAKAALKNPIFAIGVHTPDMLYLAATRSVSTLPIDSLEPGRHRVICSISDFPLLAGVYGLRMSAAHGEIPQECYYGENLAHFRVTSSDPERKDLQGEAFVRLSANWMTTRPAVAQVV